MTTADMIHKLRLELWNLSYTQWKTQTLFSIQWWSLIALIVIFYAIWWVIVDKQRLSQILLFGSFVAIQRIVMDTFGSNLALWSYNGETPFYPSPFLHDFTVTPLAFMAVYQYCHSWKKFLVWTGVVTGIISFIFFPILSKFGILKVYENWNYFYPSVMIFGIATLSRWVVLGVINIQQNNKDAKGE
ncbi:MAG TPA: CBO0543 family protein [Desulfosporosinus sp.]